MCENICMAIFTPRPPAVAALFTALAACVPSLPQDRTPTASATARVPGATATASASASRATRGAARSVEEENDLYEFKYSWPATAGAVPALAQELERRMTKLRDEMAGEARTFREEATGDGFPYHAYSYEGAWEVVADTPRFLSLSHAFYVYTGGAHGNSGMDALVWDRETGREVPVLDFFTSPAALEGALGKPFCDGLNAERRKRRGADYRPDPSDLFGGCPKLAELTVLLGSANGRTFDRIGLYAGPYVAGPYVEGAYEVTVPVTPAVLTAVKPEYRGAFALRR